MSKIVNVPVLVRVSVEIDDESLSEKELIEKAIAASTYLMLKVDNKEVQEELGEEVYVDDWFEYEPYEKVVEGNFYYGHISQVSIEEYD